MKICYFILWIIILFTINSCKISGCTDPRALNYNPKANYDNENSCEYLQSPTLIFPTQNAKIDSNLIVFSWEKQKNIDDYVFELGIDENFDSIIFSRKQIKDTNLTLYSVYDGDFFWRVKSTLEKRIISKEGESRKFTVTTKEKLLKTIEVTEVTNNSARTGGLFLKDVNAIIQYGVCWSQNENPTLNLADKSSYTSDYNTSSNGYNSYITNLTPDTKYYVRSYLRTSYGLIYGDQVSFTTEKTKLLPSVSTDQSVISLTVNSCTVNGVITENGNDVITKSGICFSSTNTNPKTYNSSVTYNSVSGSNLISCNLLNLKDNSTYYACAFATNSKGTAYGNVISFTTLPIELPTLTTYQVTKILSNSAQSGGYNINDGGGTISEYGICWATNTYQPTLSNTSDRTFGTPYSSFTKTMTSLLPNTTYYVRAYAINTAGIGYGNTLSFTTASLSPPVLGSTTYNSSSLTSSSISINLSLTSIGSSPITSMGVCYSYTSSLPTTSSSKTTVYYSSLGNYSVQLSGLLSKKKYYARTFATNQAGTVYGSVITFTTL